jgi:hypothetical protein
MCEAFFESIAPDHYKLSRADLVRPLEPNPIGEPYSLKCQANKPRLINLSVSI